MQNNREPEFEKVDTQFPERWSPRAFLPDQLSEEEIGILFEAARWAPSCFNEQPWLFAYTDSSSDRYTDFTDALNDKNREWAGKAPLLILVFSKKIFARNVKPNRWAQFDTGAAWMSLALQARKMGFYAHGMAGFSRDKAFEAAGVDPGEYDSIAAIAVGKLDEEHESGEPNSRKSLSDMIKKM